MSVILFIVVLGVLVFVHELGHFLVAKSAGIRVDEFAIGFPPRVVSYKKGETRYSINLIPFGGYVKIFGEDFAALAPDDPDRTRSLFYKNRAIQSAVIVAGVVANALFAWFLLSSVFVLGAPVSSDQYTHYQLKDVRTMIVEVWEDSPAQNAGIRAGDTVRLIRDASGSYTSPTVEEIQDFISSSEGKEVFLTIERRDGDSQINVIPKAGVVGESVGIGVSLDEVGTLRLSLFPALWEGGKRTIELFILIVQGLWDFLYRLVVFNADFSTISGPVGIAVLVSEAGTLGWFYLVSFTAIISLHLAVINLIPFPALDGGRLLFVLIEALLRRPLPPKFLHNLNMIGFMLLVALLVFVTYKDILRFL